MHFLGNKRPLLQDIDNYVVIKCATNWKELGRNLNIHEDFLNIIEKDNPYNCENCCSKMLSDWLESTPNASWAILLDAMDKTKNKLTNTSENLDTVDDMLDNAANKLPVAVEKLDSFADKLDATADKLDTEMDKLPDIVEKLDTTADKLPGTVEKLGSAVNKLPKAVNQLCEAVDKLPRLIGKVQIAEDIDLDNSTGNIYISTCSRKHFDF